MLDVSTILNVLERDSQAIRSQLGPKWPEFSRRVGGLAGRFKIAAGEDDPEVIASVLELAVNDLLEICWDYPYVETLLDRAEEDSSEPGPGIEVTKRPPLPDSGPKFSPKEIANRYYSLLTRLKKTTDQTEEDTRDRRTHS